MWSNTKRNRVITVKNVSNDGEDDAYDTWLATITFLYWPDQGTEGTDGSLRNSENWICTDTRQTSHKTLLLKVKVSRSAIFCLVFVAKSCKFPEKWNSAGPFDHIQEVWRVSSRYIITPFPHCSYVTLLVTYVMCYVKNCTESEKHNCHSLPLWIVFNCDALEIITIVLSHVTALEMIVMIVLSHVDDNSMRIQTDYWHQTDDIFQRIHVRPPSGHVPGHYIVNCL